MDEMEQQEQKMKYKFFHWGPFLYQTKIKTEECQIILEEGKKCRIESNDYRSTLAGHLSEEYTLTNEKIIIKWLGKYLKSYAEGYNRWRGVGRQGDKSTNLILKSLWINYMKAGDFNPPHHHTGDISFVIYPSMPKKIIEENKAFIGRRHRDGGPGSVSWMWGEEIDRCISVVHHLPETGDLFIFPAALKHWVFPFKSNVERISVSGNIFKK